jgi:hypothetical protein
MFTIMHVASARARQPYGCCDGAAEPTPVAPAAFRRFSRCHSSQTCSTALRKRLSRSAGPSLAPAVWSSSRTAVLLHAQQPVSPLSSITLCMRAELLSSSPKCLFSMLQHHACLLAACPHPVEPSMCCVQPLGCAACTRPPEILMYHLQPTMASLSNKADTCS